MGYFAEINPTTKRVIRTIVANSVEWCVETYGGMWAETADPHAPGQAMNYCGPGYGYDPGLPERFCPEDWNTTLATVQQQNPYTGEWSWHYNTQGALVFHNGKIWRNLMPTGNPNVWEPPTNWREYPMGNEHPLWVQPVGAVDAYPLDFIVEHNGLVWINVTPANVWPPGTDALWQQVT